MTPEEDELRRALEARSGSPSPEFRSRLSQALSTRPAGPNLMPAIALATAVVLTLTSVGILVAARHLGRTASVSPTPNPSPITGATSVQLSAPSTNVAWALVNYDHLYRSTDQGDHWEQRPLPRALGVRPAVSFIDDREGWFLAPGSPTTHCGEAAAAIWHTGDAGSTWAQLPTQGITSSQCKNGIWFVDSRRGVIVAWDDMHAATVYRTLDSGKTWVGSKLLPDPPNYQSAQGGVGYQVAWVKQFGANLYLGAIGTPYIYKSIDGGASWKWITKVGSPGTVMVTETRWLDLSVPGQAMESVNGGQQFHQYTSDFTTDTPGATQFLFADARVGYATGGGTVQRTRDGGQHWVTVIPPEGRVVTPSPNPTPLTLPFPAQLSAPSGNVVWALVAERRLFVSVDRGQTWQEGGLPFTPFTPFGFSFIDSTSGWIAAGCDELWRTTDGARSWRQLPSRGLPIADPCLPGTLDFVDQTHGFISRGPTIYGTSDGGATWSPVAQLQATDFPTPTSVDGISIRTFGSVYLALVRAHDAQFHDSMFVFRSTDDGAGWNYLAPIPNAFVGIGLVNVSFLSESRWVKILPGQSVETTDAGKTWHAYPSDYAGEVALIGDVVFGDASVGYVTIRGSIQRTEDGGLHWTPIKTPGTVAASPAPTASTCLTSPPPAASWQTYSDAQHGFTISYPRGYTITQDGAANPSAGWLAEFRAVDSCSLGTYPPARSRWVSTPWMPTI